MLAVVANPSGYPSELPADDGWERILADASGRSGCQRMLADLPADYPAVEAV